MMIRPPKIILGKPELGRFTNVSSKHYFDVLY